MKRWIYGLICTAVIMLIGASFTVAAETVTDPIGDVWHHPNNGTEGSWSGTVTNKPNIDITQISVTMSGGKITINLTVAGTIDKSSSSNVNYAVTCNTTDSIYNIQWVNGNGQGIQSIPSEHTVESNGILNVSGNTLSAVFTNLGNPAATIVDVWGTAAQYAQPGPGATTREYWEDWAPNSKIPSSVTQSGNTGNTTGGNTGNTTGGNTGNTGSNTGGNNAGKKTLGFEMLPVIAAVTVAAIILRRRR
jgi:hypothetical protein